MIKVADCVSSDEPSCVYSFYNHETQEYYIGSTMDKERRLSTHKRALAKGTHHNQKFQEAYNRNPNFVFYPEPLEEVVSREQAKAIITEKESDLINEHWGDPKMLNLSKNVHHCQIEWTDERKQKQRERMLGNTHCLGYKHPPEFAEQCRRIGVERYENNPELRERTSQMSLGNKSRTGQKQTPEEIEKRVKSLTGKKRSPEIREKMSEVQRNRNHVYTEEQRQKMSIAQTGKKQSEETKEKRRQTLMASDRVDSKSVTINGENFKSISEAARQLGIKTATAHYRVSSDSEKFKDWKTNDEQKS